MKHYQITVSRYGKFVFRTDWFDTREAAENAFTLIASYLPTDCKIQVNSTDKCMHDVSRLFEDL